MTAQDYIISKLDELKKPSDSTAELTGDELEKEIVRLILSKKFRKYAASENLIEHVKKVVHFWVLKNEPINFTYLYGAYKLWRFEEAPEADWAELFAFMYYSKWLKPICEIYEPGVLFDYFVDDIILEKMNNITAAETRAYINSAREVMAFLKNYQPKNLKMTITPSSTQFESEEDFWRKFDKNFAEISSVGPLEVSEEKIRRVELNVRPKNDEPHEEGWQQKAFQQYVAYITTADQLDYYFNRDDKILVLPKKNAFLETVVVGTTKNSVMEVEVGVGVLRRKGDSYERTILSINNIENGDFDTEEISIPGLSGKNFSQIRVVAKTN